MIGFSLRDEPILLNPGVAKHMRNEIHFVALILVLASARVGCAEPSDDSKRELARALTFHASFDESLAADFSVGDKACYDLQGAKASPAKLTDDVVLVPAGGRFGGGLKFKRKNALRPAFKDGGVLGYNDKSWSTTVSVWLRLDPDKDLEPGYCDPVQIVGDDSKKGFIFLEWSKDETPRYFRYAIRPLFADLESDERGVGPDSVREAADGAGGAGAVFARRVDARGVHAWRTRTTSRKTQRGRLYINGERQGQIENWDLTFGWNPERVMLVLGAAYVGEMDDLAVFNRAGR